MGKKRRVNARPSKFGAKHGHLLRGKNRTNKTTTVSNSVMAAKIAGSATVTDIVPVVEEIVEETPAAEGNSTDTVTTTPRTVVRASKKTTTRKARTTKAKVKTNQVD